MAESSRTIPAADRAAGSTTSDPATAQEPGWAPVIHRPWTDPTEGPAVLSAPIVCPAWCREHWASDEDLGNPDGTYTHDGLSRTFVDVEGGQVDVRLTVLTSADGTPAGAGVLVVLGDRLVTVAAATAIAGFLTVLLEQAGVEA